MATPGAADTAMNPSPPADPSADVPQQLERFLDNEQWDALLAHVDHLVREMERLPDPHVKARVFELLQGIDTLHREALHRLVRLFKEGVLEKVATDPAIGTLLELYDLLPPATDVDTPPAPAKKVSRFPNIPIRVEHSAPATTQASLPHWLPALDPADAPPAGNTVFRRLHEADVLLCRVGPEWFALVARCARDGASLEGATLNQYTLMCPAHAGCLYDVRQGSRIGGSERLVCLPVRVEENGRVLAGFGMPFTPKLPSY